LAPRSRSVSATGGYKRLRGGTEWNDGGRRDECGYKREALIYRFHNFLLAFCEGSQWPMVRIPSDADQRSELMAIAIPNSCRSPFQSDGDHRSKPMPIARPLG